MMGNKNADQGKGTSRLKAVAKGTARVALRGAAVGGAAYIGPSWI